MGHLSAIQLWPTNMRLLATRKRSGVGDGSPVDDKFYNYCIECRIEFEPKTPFIHWGGYQYHHGCFKALEQRGGVVV